MTIVNFKDLADTIQSLITAASLLLGGAWVFYKYILQQERFPNIEFTADINLIGEQAGWWVIELTGTIENKGKVQHKMEDIGFDLNAILSTDKVDVDERWGGQVNFPQSLAKGSFLPQGRSFFFVDPGVKAKYSYIGRVPKDAKFLILHCWFRYCDTRKYGHTAEKTISIPHTV